MTSKGLRRLLKVAGLSQSEAAKLLDINRRTMFRYSSGTVEIPRTVMLALFYICGKRFEK